MEKFSTQGINPGDAIYIASMGSWNIRIEKRICTRVTPTGRVIYEYGTKGEYKKTFAPDGKEIGGSARHGEWLVSEARYLEHVAQKEREAAERKVKADLEAASKLHISEVRAALEAVLAQLDSLGA